MLTLKKCRYLVGWNFKLIKRKKIQDAITILGGIFLFNVLFVGLAFSQSALEGCGITYNEQTAITQAINQMPTAPNGTVMLSPPYDIPIHVYIFRSENGVSPHPDGFDLGAVQAGLEIANQYFPEEMNFYICKVDIILDDDLHNTSPSGRGLETFYNYIHDDNAINVYYSNQGQGRGDHRGFGLSRYSMETTWFAHELGHVFDLAHTFRDTQCGTTNPDPDNITHFPNGDCNLASICSSSGCQECSNGEVENEHCNCRGDGMCDTNIDPGTNFCLSLEGEEPCIVNIGGVDYTYFPNYENLMSYYAASRRNMFSVDQKNRILETLQDEFYYLIDTNVPNNCDVIVDQVHASSGNVSYFRKDNNSTGEPTLRPMEDIFVDQLNITPNQYQTGGAFTDSNGDYDKASWMSKYLADQDIELTVESDAEAITGLTTIDIILLQRHILGLEPLSDPYALIAGDVNNSEFISTLDLILIRRVILGINQDFPNVPAWRFLPKFSLDNRFDFQTDFYNDPFNAEWTLSDGTTKKKYKASSTNDSYFDPLQLNLLDDGALDQDAWSFIGIKTGDVNFSADWVSDGFSEPSSDDDIYKSNLSSVSNNEELVLKFLLVGDQSIPHPRPKVWGYQFEVQFNPQKLELLGVFPVLDGVHPIEEEAYCLDLNTCTVRTLWYTNGNDAWEIPSMFQTQNLFAIKLRAKSSIAYGDLGNYVQLNTSNYKNQFFDEDMNLLDVNLDYGSVDPVQFKLQNIYPNPLQTNVNFDFLIEQGDSPIKITITDGNGQQVTTTRYYSYFGPTTIGMGVGNLSNGILTANIKIGNEQPFNKLLTKIN